LGSNGTLEADVKLTTLGLWNGVIAKGSTNNGTVHNYAMEVTGSNKVECTVGNGASFSAIDSVAPLTAGTFYHLACTWDGTNLKLYINGALDSTAAQAVAAAAN